MARIIGGAARGRRLRAPRGLATRPTAARVRQTLFDILAPRMAGCRFLDACAGSGAVGLEALSRGAARVVLVETDRRAVAVIRENLQALAGAGEVQVFQQDARVALAAFADAGARYDFVFLDPPYDSGLDLELLAQVGETRLLEEDGVAVVEHFHKRRLPETIGGLVRTRTVRIGDHCLTFYRPAARGEGWA
jgi:16S rRNA (guanine(966)-N(2))-methyltransferase RsmD